MKQIIILIITVTIFFSSLSVTFSKELSIDEILNINSYSEEYELNLNNIEAFSFNTYKNINFHKNMKRVNILLKKALIEKYNLGEFNYYQMSGIIHNYNNFIYHTNQFFFYLQLKETNPEYIELNNAIITSSQNMRNSYFHLKNIIK